MVRVTGYHMSICVRSNFFERCFALHFCHKWPTEIVRTEKQSRECQLERSSRQPKIYDRHWREGDATVFWTFACDDRGFS